MSRITKFSQITSSLPYPAQSRGLLQSIHSSIVTAVCDKGVLTRKESRNVIRLINTITYQCVQQESISWKKEDPLNLTNLTVDEDTLQQVLGSMYLVYKHINWKADEIEIVAETKLEITNQADKKLSGSEPSERKLSGSEPVEKNLTGSEPIEKKSSESAPEIATVVTQKVPVYVNATSSSSSELTPKEDLYIQPPLVPRFNPLHIIASKTIGDCQYEIYESYPIIPKKQNEISMTTDVNRMTSKDLRNLFPNRRICTRASVMYEEQEHLEMHPILGLILPIEGFTRDQLIDNLIKYPHIFRLTKVVNNEIVSFYTTVEINGELQKITEIWNTLPESKYIPYNRDFVKEYVVRRYLLERDVKGVHHKYPLFGTLDPYLTLFTTPDEYIQLGIDDVDSLARSCVRARVSYKQSRNPVIRRLQNA